MPHDSLSEAPLAPPDPPLSDGVVLLRPFVREDAPRIAQICQDPEIARWIPLVPRPYKIEDAIAYVASTEENWLAARSHEFAVIDVATNLLVGSIGLHRDPAPHRGAVGYWVAGEARGKGVATRATRLVVGWAFARFGFARISLWTLPGNRASQRVAEKAGFRYEGILRRWDRDRDEAADVVMFGLTREEFEEASQLEAGGLEPEGLLATTPPELRVPGTRSAPFIDLLAGDDLAPGEMRRITLAGIDVLVARTPDGLVATDDRCPHMSAPLSIGDLDGCVVACPLHEGRFDLCSGETVQMPTTGGLDADGNYHASWSPRGTAPKPEPASKKLEARRLTRVNRLRYYPLRVRGGRIEIQLPIVPE